MEKKPLVSVIIPTFKSYNYLHDCITSIVNQTYSNLEILVIDDTPNDDGTEGLLVSFNDKRIQYIKPEDRLGLVKSLNYGIEISKGKYIARMDADDISHLERVEKQVDYLENHPEVGIVGCNCYKINARNKVIGFIDHPEINEDIKIKMLFNAAFIHPAVMLRRSSLVELYDERIRYSEDYELWSRLMDKTEFHNLKERLFKYRILEDSAMHNQLMRIATDEEFYCKYKSVLSQTYDNVLRYYGINDGEKVEKNYLDLLLSKRIEAYSIKEREIFLIKCMRILLSKYPDNHYIYDCIGYQWLKMSRNKFALAINSTLRYRSLIQGLKMLNKTVLAKIYGNLRVNKNVYQW